MKFLEYIVTDGTVKHVFMDSILTADFMLETDQEKNTALEKYDCLKLHLGSGKNCIFYGESARQIYTGIKHSSEGVLSVRDFCDNEDAIQFYE